VTTLRKTWSAVAVAAAAALALGACSSDKPADNAAEGTATTEAATDAATEEATDSAAAPVEITWWGWAPGYQEAADAFNASHDNIQIKFEQVTSGSQGGYDKMLTAVQAGNAPCLAQVGSETFTSFLAQGALEDISAYVDDAAKAEFSDGSWATVSLGDAIYGIPVDSGTMGMFYRTDVFEEYGIDVPTTWEEFQAAGEKLLKANPDIHMVNLPTDAYNYSGYAWQAGAKWFSADNDAWTVSIDSDANKKVADYWQGLVDSGVASTLPSWDASLYSAWNDGTVATEVGAVWTLGLLKSEAADSAGKWAVAPMPVWDGSDAVGNVGGSPNAVLKGCQNPAEAAEAAIWISTATESIDQLIDLGGLYPASVSGQANPKLAEPDEFFGGQEVYKLFGDESAKVNPDWTWGPVMTVTSSALADGLGKVGSGEGTVADALAAAQTATVDEIKAQGYALNE
jgi:multiple sugar transport system substrate-binding protein